ncbi:peptidoglycan DD-metalloendopeptidase family protein [bacterium]|nr:peptidoglycan DD-metalloendopeptidase family protein [bacterium]
MKIKNILKYVFVCIIAFGIIGLVGDPVLSAPAQSSAQLKQKLRQTNNKRNYLQQQKRNADLRLRREQNKLSNNQQKLEVAHEKLQKNTIRYNNLVTNLSSMEVQLNHALAEFQKLDAAMKQRIRQVFMHQRTGMFDSILNARDVNTLLDTFYFEKIVIMEDYRRIQALKAKAQHIAALKSQVERQKRMIESSIRDINNQRTAIQNSIAANKSMIERLKKDKAYYEKTEKELANQSANIQNMIAKLSKNNAGSSSQVKITSTGFIRPISGPITSPFGYRIHPIFKSRIFHSGIDIGGPNGGAIKASNDGKVIYSGWYGGYGKVVILDHGVVNGQPITTLYAHMSSIGVSNGQMVKKGQTLGREGSTGYSTGPHCHFEVRVNGKPVNPLNYVR